jgi:hypothetical protein
MRTTSVPKKDNFDLLMTWEQLKQECPTLHDWFKNGFKFGVGGPDFEHLPISKLENRYQIKLYTHNNVYNICARPPSEENKKGYLGCTSDSRIPVAGENWTRGSDLHDGSFSAETWLGILTDIVSYELVQIESQADFEKMHAFEKSRREGNLR